MKKSKMSGNGVERAGRQTAQQERRQTPQQMALVWKAGRLERMVIATATTYAELFAALERHMNRDRDLGFKEWHPRDFDIVSPGQVEVWQKETVELVDRYGDYVKDDLEPEMDLACLIQNVCNGEGKHLPARVRRELREYAERGGTVLVPNYDEIYGDEEDEEGEEGSERECQ